MRSMLACCTSLIFALSASSSCLVAEPLAQQTTTPGLHQRTAQNNADAAERPATKKKVQPSTLPKNVSGAYNFDHLNESIEIDIERNNKLSGYISRLGDAETDDNTPLTYFFDHATVDGTQIEFQTRVLHGVWYSFRGTIVRGNGETRDDEGYYVLHGILQEHHPADGQEKTADETILRRAVNFKSMAQ
ncbi:MAG: hypothetical protein ACYDC6_08195 [Acidobacteriaceae bacterium]